jgi:hypothetical protein
MAIRFSDDVKHPVKHPVKQPEKAAKQVSTEAASVRSSPDAFRAYHRASMAERRAKAKAAHA